MQEAHCQPVASARSAALSSWGTYSGWEYLPWPRSTYPGWGGTYSGHGVPTLAEEVSTLTGSTYSGWGEGVPTLAR